MEDLMNEAAETGEHTLKKTLGAGGLIALGIGAIIGAGLFSITGMAAANHAGPAITISFIVAGFGCLFAGLCYAEFASMIPVAGSAYTILMRPWENLLHGSLDGTLFLNMLSAQLQ